MLVATDIDDSTFLNLLKFQRFSPKISSRKMNYIHKTTKRELFTFILKIMTISLGKD